jgi:hypothetical protein
MTAALTAPAIRGETHREPPPWLAAADPREGIRVRVDGVTTLHTALLAEPHYRVDVLSQDCAVELSAEGALLRFSCLPADDGGDPPLPAPHCGWSVEGFDARLGRHRLPARVTDVLCACAGEREATEAVAEITRWVARECALRAEALRPTGRGRADRRAAATAWRGAGKRLASSLATARGLRRAPVRPLRDEFLRQCARGELTAMELARRLGWYWPASTRRPDSARVLRRLSLIAEPSERRQSAYKRSLSAGERAVYEQLEDHSACLSYELAVKVCRALGCDPADFGCL